MQDSVKWALAAVRTPRGWVGRYDTFGPNGKTAHIPVVPSLAQEIAPIVAKIQAVKAEAARAETVSNLRHLVPFVQWKDRPYGPRQGRYTTSRQTSMFNEDLELEEGEWQDYQDALREQGYDPEEMEEEEVLELIQYFWGLEG